MWKSWQKHTHLFTSHIHQRNTQGNTSIPVSEFSGAQCIILATYCRYILQSRHGHCKGTHFLIFLLKILKDCDNLISLGTGAHFYSPRNEMDFAPCLTECLTEFTLCLVWTSYSHGYSVRNIRAALPWI